MIRMAIVACLVLIPALARADAPVVTLEPAAVDTFRVQFLGRTLSTATIRCWAIKGTDADPVGMITNETSVASQTATIPVSGDEARFQFTPTSGRANRSYQCVVQGTDTSGNMPTVNFRVDVRTIAVVL